MHTIPKKDRQPRHDVPSSAWSKLVYSRFNLTPNKKRLIELWKEGYSHKDAAMILANEQELS